MRIWNRKQKGLVRLAISITLIILLITNILQGFMRYGMIIGVLLIQSVINLIAYKTTGDKKYSKGRQIGAFFLNILLYFIALIPAFLFPQYKPLPLTGSHMVETTQYTYVDTSRIETFTDTGENRALTVKFWYPKEEGIYPLIIFSHGAFGMIDSNYSTNMELASHGYVVASIGHPYHAMFVEDENGKVTVASKEFIEQIYTANGDDTPENEKLTYDNSRIWMEVRAADMNFVLDTILEKAEAGAEPLFAKIDCEKIGLFGHSMGGATAVKLGRERDDIGAVIDLEGTMLGEYTGFENGAPIFNEEPYKVPLLDVNSRDVYELAKEVKGNGYVNFYVGEHALSYEETVINGAGHLNFTDLPMVSPLLAKMLGVGTVNSRDCITDINHIVLVFFDYYLKGEGELNIKKEYGHSYEG